MNVSLLEGEELSLRIGCSLMCKKPSIGEVKKSYGVFI